MFKAKFGVRGRVLAIALVPSLALLSASVGVSVYLFDQGSKARHWSSDIRADSAGPAWLQAVEQERLLSLLQLTGVRPDAAALTAARAHLDATFLAATQNAAGSLQTSTAMPADAESMYNQLSAQISSIRKAIDAGQVLPQGAYDFFNQLITLAMQSMTAVGNNAPEASTAMLSNRAQDVFYSLEALTRGAAITTIAAIHSLNPNQLSDYNERVGYYHNELATVAPTLAPAARAKLTAIMNSPAWQRLSNLENAVLRRGTDVPDNDTDVDAVRAREGDVTEIADGLSEVWNAQLDATLGSAGDSGDNTTRNSLLGGSAAIGVAVLAFLVALWISSRLVGRLRRLRAQTLALADEQLPHIMNMLTLGSQPDMNTEVTKLDFGSDEIGEVADAFNRAQGAAIAAAVTEAKTREGVKAVFLNIAHRSQVVVHKQLEILDKAEYETEDPKQLDMLFQLDHLATRERRNAENLIILGGEQPGRRWRTPVALVELVRSAAAETEDYARVHIGRTPELLIAGSVVADLIHLLAELVDNATSFSPPSSRVEVVGSVVGRGVVVEITDQGLGMAAEEIDRTNENLRNPPDFSISNLTSDSRLGLFVVAQLATRTGASVRLIESDYGGIRAIVLIPTQLIAAEHTLTDPGTGAEQAPPLRRRMRITAEHHPTTGEIPLVSRPIETPSVSTPTSQATLAGPPTNGDRPALPRRSRQKHLAPQLTENEPTSSHSNQISERPRSAEQARDLLSAIEGGTRQGRHVQPEPVPSARYTDEREDQW